MKKIALLFIILCAGHLYGMKRPAGEHYVENDIRSELKPEIWGQLPEEVKALIMIALAQSDDDIDETINNIKKVSLINKTLNQMINVEYGNLQGFTQLVHILADKFAVTTSIIAEGFKTSVAKQYIELGKNLILCFDLLRYGENQNISINGMAPLDNAVKLIKEGADVNFTFSFFHMETTPMGLAIISGNTKAILLLLNHGAKLEPDKYYDTNDCWPEDVATKQAMKQFIGEIRSGQ